MRSTSQTVPVFLFTFSLLCSGLGIGLAQANDENRAVQTINRLDGLAGYHYQYDARGKFIPDAEPPGPAWLRRALGVDFFAHLVDVDLSFNVRRSMWGFGPSWEPKPGDLPIVDEDLQDIARLSRLESLWLDHISVTERGLRHLRGIEHWKSLNVWDYTFKDLFGQNIEWHYAPGGLFPSRSHVSDAGLEHLSRLRRLQMLSLNSAHVSDAGAERLARLRELRYLSLWAPQVTDAGIKHLEKLRNLEALFLPATKITDKGLDSLTNLRGLRELSISHTKITGAGLVYLKALPHLEALYLDYTRVDDSGLQHLKNRRGLQEVTLSWTPVTGAGLIHLGGLNQLEVLDLDYTKVDDSGLQHLKGLSRLRLLRLNNTLVSDRGLQHLKTLTSLRELSLLGTQVTAEGVKRLEEALPKCEILWDGNSGVVTADDF